MRIKDRRRDKDYNSNKIINTSKPLFTEEDFENTDDLLIKMLMRIFIDKNITYRDFVIAHKRYMKNKNSSTKQISYSRNNLLKALMSKQNYTYRLFKVILRDILQINLVSMTCEFIDIDNNKHEYTVKSLTF